MKKVLSFFRFSLLLILIISAVYVPSSPISNTQSVKADDAWCSNASCNTSWLNRRKVTFNNSASAENLDDFPVVVQLSTLNSNVDYSKTKNAGEDIRFTDSNGTALSYQIESWNESATSTIWVKVPRIDSGSITDYIWMYYNNTSASDAQAATSVWNSGYRSVHHMNESVSASVLDSTSNDVDGTGSGGGELQGGGGQGGGGGGGTP